MDYIADALNTNPIQLPLKEIETEKSLFTIKAEEFEKQVQENQITDYTTVRDNLTDIIETTKTVVENAAKEASTNPSARAFESFAALIKTYAELNTTLLEISGNTKKSTDSKSKSSQAPGQSNNPVNNLVFVGTSDNLIDTIRSAIK